MFTWSHYPPASVIGELFFKPVKTYYAETWSQNVKKKKIPQFNIGSSYIFAWTKKDTGTYSVAESGFASTGTFPFNANIVEYYEFLRLTVYSFVEGNHNSQQFTSCSIPETPHGPAELVDTIEPSPSTSCHCMEYH